MPNKYYKVRETHNRILELIKEGIYTYKQILEELLSWLPSDEIDQFFETAFGNEGIEPQQEE